MANQAVRVLQFVKGLDIGGINGGADLFGSNLACTLQKQGIDSRLCVFYRMNTPVANQHLARLSECGIPIFFLQDWIGRTSIGSYFIGLLRLALYLRKEHIQILHSHFQVGTLIAILLKMSGCVRRIVRTAHIDREWQRGWEGPIQRLLIRGFIFLFFPLFVDRECGVSQTAVDILNHRRLARWMKRNSPLIYNAIDVPENPFTYNLTCEPEVMKNVDSFIIGSVGRLTEQKGYTYLINAVPHVLRDLPNARFWIAGQGPLYTSLQQQVRNLGVESQVELLGNRDDIPALLDRTDLFVLPSVYEGLPTVVLESMARGVPVIATDIPGTREIIRDRVNGWLIPARDPKALANAILQAVRNPQERAGMVRAALQSLVRFSMNTAAEQYADLFRGLV